MTVGESSNDWRCSRPMRAGTIRARLSSGLGSSPRSHNRGIAPVMRDGRGPDVRVIVPSNLPGRGHSLVYSMGDVTSVAASSS